MIFTFGIYLHFSFKQQQVFLLLQFGVICFQYTCISLNYDENYVVIVTTDMKPSACLHISIYCANFIQNNGEHIGGFECCFFFVFSCLMPELNVYGSSICLNCNLKSAAKAIVWHNGIFFCLYLASVHIFHRYCAHMLDINSFPFNVKLKPNTLFYVAYNFYCVYEMRSRVNYFKAMIHNFYHFLHLDAIMILSKWITSSNNTSAMMLFLFFFDTFSAHNTPNTFIVFQWSPFVLCIHFHVLHVYYCTIKLHRILCSFNVDNLISCIEWLFQFSENQVSST